MASISNLQLNYESITGGTSNGSTPKLTPENIVSTAISIFCSLSAANTETTDTATRAATSASQSAETITNIQGQTQVCMNAITKLMEMAQEGQITLEQTLNFINDTILQTIGANNDSATALSKEIEQYNQENEDILAQIEELNNGSLEGIDLSSIESDGESTQQTDENGNPINKSSNKENNKLAANPNQSKIQELLAKLSSNQGKISMLGAAITNLGVETQQTVQDGQGQQETAKTTFGSIVNNLQGEATNYFTNIGTTIKNFSTQGITQQSTNKATMSAYSTSDTKAAAEAYAKAAASGIANGLSGGIGGLVGGLLGGLFGGGGGTNPAEYLEAAGLFTAAAGENMTNGGIAEGFKTTIKQVGTELGNQFAQNISTQVNNAINGALTQAVNDITGVDISSYVQFDFSKYMNPQDDQNQA